MSCVRLSFLGECMMCVLSKGRNSIGSSFHLVKKTCVLSRGVGCLFYFFRTALLYIRLYMSVYGFRTH